MADQKMLDKIKALFAKAEASTFEGEADLFNAKAIELMVKNSVTESMLAGTSPVSVTIETIYVGKALTVQQLLTVACRVCDVVSVKIMSGVGRSTRATGDMHMVGLPSDIVMAKMLFTSLVMQLESALARAYVPADMHARTFNNSFRMGFNACVLARLTAAREAATATTPGAALVLRSKLEVARRAAPSLLSNYTPGKTVKRALNEDAYRAGQAAGERARLGRDKEIQDARLALNA